MSSPVEKGQHHIQRRQEVDLWMTRFLLFRHKIRSLPGDRTCLSLTHPSNMQMEEACHTSPSSVRSVPKRDFHRELPVEDVLAIPFQQRSKPFEAEAGTGNSEASFFHPALFACLSCNPLRTSPLTWSASPAESTRTISPLCKFSIRYFETSGKVSI